MFSNHNAHVVTFKQEPIYYEIYSAGDALAEGKITSGEYSIIMNRLHNECDRAEIDERLYCMDAENRYCHEMEFRKANELCAA
jgi:hypothetical protein